MIKLNFIISEGKLKKLKNIFMFSTQVNKEIVSNIFSFYIIYSPDGTVC